jgi:hypothetical protein
MSTRSGRRRFRNHKGPDGAEETHQARIERELHEAMYATIQATHHALVSVQRWSAEAHRAAAQRRAGNPADDRHHWTARALQVDLTQMFQESHRLYVAVRTSMSDKTARRLADQASGLLERFSADQQCANALGYPEGASGSGPSRRCDMCRSGSDASRSPPR